MRTTLFFFFATFLLITNTAFAQSIEPAKVVVVPLFGDDSQSGVTYSAQAPMVISTPDPNKPNEKLISFTAPADQIVNLSQPSLSLYYVIALQGVFPSRSLSTDPILASIDLFGGNFAPRGWATCAGQLLPISQNQALFSILGTTFGGDGRTTLGLPDLRGRVAVGQGNGPGLTPRTWGQKFGSERATIDHL